MHEATKFTLSGTAAAMDKFEIRTAGLDDRQDVIRLMSKIYAGDMSSRYDWLYVENPHGRALTWLAIERASGEAVGCTSIFPRRVMVRGHERIGGIGGDCFIEPRVRRQGLATSLHSVSFAQMRERGVDFMYGPPTPNNLAALVKAGSHLVTNYRRWVRPLTSRGAYRAAFSRVPTKGEAQIASIPLFVLDHLTKSDSKGFTLEEVLDFPDEFNAMFEHSAVGHEVICGRDRDYLRWRYLEAPAHLQTPLAVRCKGELVGFVALERDGEFATIADLFCPPDVKPIDAILQLVIEYAHAAGCSTLETNGTQDSAFARRLRRHGFIGREERGFQVAVAPNDPDFGVLTDAHSWHFTEADQDMDRVFLSHASEAHTVHVG